jgi:hypothetical protein
VTIVKLPISKNSVNFSARKKRGAFAGLAADGDPASFLPDPQTGDSSP